MADKFPALCAANGSLMLMKGNTSGSMQKEDL
jgi:hypothetical protein